MYDAMPENLKTTVTYNTLITRAARAGQLRDAFDFLRAAPKPDAVTYTALVRGYVEAGDLDAGREAFDEMRTAGIRPDAAAYNTLVKGLCEAGRSDEGWRIMEVEMVEGGVEANGMTMSYVLQGLVKEKRYGDCTRLFGELIGEEGGEGSSAASSVFLYTTAITAAARTRDFTQALNWIRRMKSDGLTPNLYTLTSLMKACTAGGRGDLSLGVWKTVVSRAEAAGEGGEREVDGRARLAALEAYLQQERWEEGLELVEESEKL